MKTKNTLVELLQHQLKLAEAGKKIECGQFEFFVKRSGKWYPYPGCFPDFMNGDDWRIADQDHPTDQHLHNDGWICLKQAKSPLHALDIIEVMRNGVCSRYNARVLDFAWHRGDITHYRVIEKYIDDEHLIDTGWILHVGKTCPVSNFDTVEVLCKDKCKRTSVAALLRWDTVMSDSIVHYRVIKPHASESFVLNGVRLNKPYTEALPLGTVFSYIEGKVIHDGIWENSEHQQYLLREFRCWKTNIDALTYYLVIKNMTRTALLDTK